MFRGAVLVVFLAVALVSEGKSSPGSHWKYGETGYGPDDWKEVSKHCSESAQSPINIDTSAVQKNPNLKGLSFTCDNREKGEVSGRLTNNGHAPTLSIDKSKGTATLTGGPLGDSKYQLEQFHFHFGCDDDKGSEHTVDGKAFSGELHLVTYNTKYPNFKAAANKPDGLAVIGAFLKENDEHGNRELGYLCRYKIKKIRKADSAILVQRLYLYNLVLQLKHLSKASFFSYKGSLTTPPCYQSVSWIVLKEPIAASEDDLYEMRRLLDHEERSFCDNFRPTQPLNGRTVSEYSD